MPGHRAISNFFYETVLKGIYLISQEERLRWKEGPACGQNPHTNTYTHNRFKSLIKYPASN